MYKPKECFIDTLKPKAMHFAQNGGDPKEILDACSYLQFFPAMRSLRQRLVMKAYEELQKNDKHDFKVYRLLCKQSIELFLKDSSAWHQGISLFALRKMVERKRERKHEKAIKECSSEMEKLVVSQILMAKIVSS